jgi:signal peptidase II
MFLKTLTARAGLLLVIVLGLVGCDQATKVYAVRHLKGRPPQSYCGDLLRIQYEENPGAFLGMLGQSSAELRFWLLTVGNAAILAAVAWFALRTKVIDWWSFVALALLIAGGVGNLIDRARLGGLVIDFLNVGVGPRVWQRTGIFNVADMAITAGFLLLLPMVLKRDPAPGGEPSAA